ncbi:hypothetical protein QBC46DRAFT_378542 [Diplogelasinospora grovesii]|uniref:Uncharacterized protein n=1 Tax=Diplogelasinospora grovesii TaxID=303347 RepID=A0AAN6NCJ6_9PEZI|nr:hypothetical protein QBC46DRAFT_378542 [Diplogelasinospora grovesii]
MSLSQNLATTSKRHISSSSAPPIFGAAIYCRLQPDPDADPLKARTPSENGTWHILLAKLCDVIHGSRWELPCPEYKLDVKTNSQRKIANELEGIKTPEELDKRIRQQIRNDDAKNMKWRKLLGDEYLGEVSKVHWTHRHGPHDGSHTEFCKVGHTLGFVLRDPKRVRGLGKMDPISHREHELGRRGANECYLHAKFVSEDQAKSLPDTDPMKEVLEDCFAYIHTYEGTTEGFLKRQEQKFQDLRAGLLPDWKALHGWSGDCKGE